jgi:hypothetical protein
MEAGAGKPELDLNQTLATGILQLLPLGLSLYKKKYYRFFRFSISLRMAMALI